MLLQDIRYALRSLWHTKAFATVAITCLAFGIGLNTTIFSIVDGVLLKPFPYHEPDRIFVLETYSEKQGIARAGVSYLDWQDLRGATKAFTTVTALQFQSIALSDTGGEPARYPAAAVSWDLFPMLGIAPIYGTMFTPEMDKLGAEGVVLISHHVWRDRYQSDPGAVGRKVLLNGKPAVIIGVMPEHFGFPNNQRLWVPVTPIVGHGTRDQRALQLFARLAPEHTLETARVELATFSAQQGKQYSATNQDLEIQPATLRDLFIPDSVSLVIWIMMASVTLVLFIACSNVANLLLARATGRRREFSVRAALGAGRSRIVRQLLTESIVLSVVSLPFAVLLAQAGTRMIASAMPTDQVPYYITWAVDWRTMFYAVAVAVGTAVLFGLLPSLQTSRGNLVDSLKEGGRGTSVRRSPLRSVLVVTQVALALVSLVGALLFVRTFANLDSYEVGFDPKPLMTMRFYMPGEVYEQPDAKARRVEDVVRRIETISRVKSAFASNLIPVSGGGGGGRIVIDGQPTDPGKEPEVAFVGVTPHFYRTLGMTTKEGRDFTDAEGWSTQPLAIINETMARRFWPKGSAVGARLRLVGNDNVKDWFTIIGVARDIKHDDIDPEDGPFESVYVPFHFQQTFSVGLTIRVDGDPASITTAVREQIRAADATLPISFVRTMEEVRRLSFWEYGLFGWIFGVTGVVGLLLASVGVYGVLSYAVTQRSAEIGVRMALGAARREVLGLIVGHGLTLAGIGVIVGLVLAPLGTWFGRSLFYNVSPFDPVTFVAVAVFLMLVAVAASFVPALRATRVDPVDALRGE